MTNSMLKESLVSNDAAARSELRAFGRIGKPHIYYEHGFWNCRAWIDYGSGPTPELAYMEMVLASDYREQNRRCF